MLISEEPFGLVKTALLLRALWTYFSRESWSSRLCFSVSSFCLAKSLESSAAFWSFSTVALISFCIVAFSSSSSLFLILPALEDLRAQHEFEIGDPLLFI